MTVEYQNKDHIAVIDFTKLQNHDLFPLKERQDIRNALLRFRDDDEAWVGILRIEGPQTPLDSLNIDPTAMKSLAGEVRELWMEEFRGQEDFLNLVEMDLFKPLVGALSGRCTGASFLLSLLTDIRVASAQVTLGYVSTRWALSGIGMNPGIVLRHLPYPIGMELLLRGRVFTAAEAQGTGLVNYVAPPEKVLAQAQAIARDLCDISPYATRTIKEMVLRGADLPAYYAERLQMLLSKAHRTSLDGEEGVQALKERRKPRFQGR